ncbi:SusC/RagA family TonB-linked outer membrane protein, partial [Bacteroidota bacterium]
IIGGGITDANGNYYLQIKNLNAKIIVSFIGYTSFEFEVQGREVIDVELTASSIQMDEIIITAESGVSSLTGLAQRDITSSQVRIDMEDSRHLGVVSAEEALQGQVSGLDIMTSGSPGAGSQIVIRGMSSLGGSTPLIVVDDIAQDIAIDESFDFGSADQEDIGDLVNISPQDIKSIDVLKDAASAAIWGSKGADGVLMITTHRGRKGKTRFEYQGKYTTNIQPPPIPMLNGDEYIMMQLEQLHNQLGLFDIPPEIAYDRDYIDFYNYNKNTDWVEEISQTGFINDQYFKVSGGGDKTRYFASMNYQTNRGTTVNQDLNRLSTRINLDYDISEKISLQVSFNYTNSIKGDNYRVGGRDVRSMAYVKAPNMSIWEYDENGEPTGEYFTPIYSYQGDGDTYFNPVAVANLSINDQNTNQAQNSFVLNYRVLPWLRFRETVSFQYLNRKSKQFLPIDAIGTDWLNDLNNGARESNQTTTRITTRSQLIFQPQFKTRTHYVSGNLIYEAEMQNTEAATLATSRGPGGDIQDPAANAPIKVINSGSSEARATSVMSNFTYKLLDRYSITLTARVDGSSKFGSNQRYGVFPSLSAGWRFSQENWLSGFDQLSNGRLRFSLGQTGKQPSSAYDRHAIFNTTSPNQYIDNRIIIQQQVQLDNLKWQTVSTGTIGLDLGFIKNRISITAEVYQKITEDILWKNYKIPTSSGYALLKWYNGGVLENKGWELFTRFGIIKKKDLNWNISFNIARNYNVFREFPENFNNEVATTIGNGEYPRRADIGQPIGTFYGFKYQGVWPSDNDVVAKDANGDVLLDVNGDPVPLNFNEQYQFVGGDAI